MSAMTVGRMKIDNGFEGARYHAVARGKTKASADQVWSLLADVTTWSQWGPWDATTLLEPGSDNPAGVGAVRSINRGRVVSIEEVTDFKPGRRLAYKLRSGLPLRNYRAEVLLRSVDDGTEITWHSAFDGAPGGMARLAQLAFARFLRTIVKRLAMAAEQRA